METTFAEQFVTLLNQKFPEEAFTVNKGRKYDKVVARGSVHAFVEKTTGHVYKPAGWNAPAKGVRYTSPEQAAEHADKYGSYLYAK